MKPKQILLTAVMLAALYGGSGSLANLAQAQSAQPGDKRSSTQTLQTAGPKSPAGPSYSETEQDEFLQALGCASEEEVRDALLQGFSLADIAAANRREIRPIIDLQITQLSDQLNERVRQGELSEEEFRQLQAELPALIEQSVRGDAWGQEHAGTAG